MRCINKEMKKRYILAIILCFIWIAVTGCAKEKIDVTSYETEIYNKELAKDVFFAQDLCVAAGEVKETNFSTDTELSGAGLFDLANKKVLYAEGLHDMVYPASTTKIMTALLALEHGNLDDLVTIGSNADAGSFQPDEQVCGFRTGDQLTLRDLLNGLLLYSGNDAAIAVAEHISGSVEEFSNLMNERAFLLMATNTHFTNPHGLHDDDHYTTVYDLYLIFNEALKHEAFKKIIEVPSYTMEITAADGSSRQIESEATNFYSRGETPQPQAATVIGGKTGTTGEAGYCVVLYDMDANGNSYISIAMGAPSKPLLYQNMTALINSIGTEKIE